MAVMTSAGMSLAQSQQNFNNGGNQAQQNQPATVQAIPEDNGQPQQLPDGFAQQQIPNSFSMGDEASAQATSDQIIPAASDGNPDNGEVVNADSAPSQPQEQKLVPATAMGQAAQGAQQSATPNPVEDTAAQADAELQAQQNDPAGVSALDRYRAAAEAEGTSSADGDALPEVDTSAMFKLQGDFENSAGKTSYGTVDGNMNSEPSPEARRAMKESIRRDAFDAAITGMFPLEPNQIQSLLGRYDETQRAVNTPPFDSPRPEVSVTNISLDPGVMPPTIKTAVGNVTTINILDATGAPWPVQDVTWAGDFEVVEPEQGGHIIRITPLAQFARGNIVIRLLTLKTPLTLTLETNRDVVQYRVDARVPEYGPFATAPLMQGGKSMVAGDSTLTSLLDGVAGQGMTKLSVSGVDGRTTAYASGGQTYVRTPLTLLSPAWKSSVSSADGMNVYVLSSAPVLLLSDEGEFMRATLTEKEDLLDE